MPQIGFNYSLVGMRKIDSTLMNNQSHWLKGIYPEFQVIRGFSQKILADLLSYDQIHS